MSDSASRPPAGPEAEIAPILERIGRQADERAAQRTFDLYAKKLSLPPSPASLPTDAQLEAVRSRALDARAALGWAGGRTLEELQPPLREALEIWDDGGYEWYWEARKANVPRGLWIADLATAQQTAAVRAARQFCLPEDEEDWDAVLDSPARVLGLLGPVGCGKSFAGTGAMRELRVVARTMAFLHFRTLSRALLDPERRDEALEEAIETDLILIDDVGGYLKVDGLIQNLVEEVVLERELDRNRWTILTSNYRADRLYDLLGDRLRDRLESDWGRIVEVRGPSLRRRLGLTA